MNIKEVATSKVIKLAVAAAASLTGVLAVASPASAATSVSFCSPAGSRPVQLVEVDAYGRPTTRVVRHGRSGANGCGTFYNTPTNKRLAVTFDMKWGSAVYHASSDRYATPGNGAVNLGNLYQWKLLCNQCSLD